MTTKTPYIIGGLVLVVVVILFATVYGSYLTTKVAPGARFKILTPKNLTAGKTATILWEADSEDVKKHSFQEIRYCTGNIFKNDCLIISERVPNSGKVVIELPASLPAGEGYFKFTGLDGQGALDASSSSTSSTVVINSKSN
jgi:hypothetical protein